MNLSPEVPGPSEHSPSVETIDAAPPLSEVSPVKVGRILDEEEGGFGFEYDDTRGQKNTMRLDALTYEGAIREARSYLGIGEDDQDEDGDRWAVE
jgi:hypothetical protein